MRRIMSLRNSSSLLLLVWNLHLSLSLSCSLQNPINYIAVYPTLPLCHHYMLMGLIDTSVISSPAPLPHFFLLMVCSCLWLGWSSIPVFKIFCHSDYHGSQVIFGNSLVWWKITNQSGNFFKKHLWQKFGYLEWIHGISALAIFGNTKVLSAEFAIIWLTVLELFSVLRIHNIC